MDKTSSRRFYALLGLIFIAAMAVRLVFVYQWYATPYGDYPLIDADAYDKWAQEIANGSLIRGKAFYQSPLYPYLLGLIYAIFGHKYVVASFLNAALSALVCPLLVLITRRCFGFGAAVITGILAVFYRPYIFYAAPLLKESLGLFLLCLFLLIALRSLDRPKPNSIFLSGLVLGLASLVRGNILLLGFAHLPFLFAGLNLKTLNRFSLFLVGIVLAILPATLHNAIASRDFVPMTYNGGFNFFIGSSPGSLGAAVYPAGISSDPLYGEENDTRRIAEKELGRPLRPSEISSYWFDRGLKSIIHTPMEALVRVINKIWLAVDDHEHGDNYDIQFFNRNFDSILRWPLARFSVLLVAGVFAAFALWNRQNRHVKYLALSIVVYVVSLAMFYVTDRYRLPLTVFLLPLAGAAFPAAADLIKEWRIGRFALATSVASLILMASQILVNGSLATDAHKWALLAHVEYFAGKNDEAIAYLEKGLALSFDGVPVESLNVGYQAAVKLGLQEREKRYKTLILRAMKTTARN